MDERNLPTGTLNEFDDDNEPGNTFLPPVIYKTPLDRLNFQTQSYTLDLPQQIFVTFEDERSSGLAAIISLLLNLAVVLSATVYVVSTDSSLTVQTTSCDKPACDHDPNLCPGEVICPPTQDERFEYIEAFCVLLFVVDYVVRVATVSHVPARVAGLVNLPWDIDAASISPEPEFSPFMHIVKYLVKPMNIIDLVAIVPFFIHYFTPLDSSFSVIRIFRLGRVLRVLKFTKTGSTMEAFGLTFENSASALLIMTFFTSLGVVVFASLIYLFEQGEFVVSDEYPDGAYIRQSVTPGEREISPFTSIGSSLYWASVTLTTLGYGDMYPTSTVGRFFTMIWMFCGVLLIALPISVLGSNFSVALKSIDERNKKKRMSRWKVLRKSLIKNVRSASITLGSGGGKSPSGVMKAINSVMNLTGRRKGSAPPCMDSMEMASISRAGTFGDESVISSATTKNDNGDGGTGMESKTYRISEENTLDPSQSDSTHEQQVECEGRVCPTCLSVTNSNVREKPYSSTRTDQVYCSMTRINALTVQIAKLLDELEDEKERVVLLSKARIDAARGVDPIM